VIAKELLMTNETPDEIRACAEARADDILRRAHEATRNVGEVNRQKTLRVILTEALVATFIEGRACTLIAHAKKETPA
jgi:hypothetical protein